MTRSQKILIQKLLTGHFLRKMKTRSGVAYILYDKSISSVGIIRMKTVDTIDRFLDPKLKLWKRDKHGNMTLNLQTVRQLHGRSTIKKMYKMRDQLANTPAIYKSKTKRKKHFNDEKANTLF